VLTPGANPFFFERLVWKGHLVSEYGGQPISQDDSCVMDKLARLQRLMPQWADEWKRHVRFFSQRGSAAGREGKQARPQFKKQGSKTQVQYSLQTLFKTAKLGGFINSSKCGGGGNGTANVQAVLYEGRQFYIATRDIEVGEEILHDYPCLDHHNDGIPSLAWFMKGGLSHDLEVLLADAEELAREGGDDAAVGTGEPVDSEVVDAERGAAAEAEEPARSGGDAAVDMVEAANREEVADAEGGAAEVKAA
jgi:hypothetical protein